MISNAAEALRALVRAKTLVELASALSGHIALSRSVVLVRVWVGPPNALSLTSSAGTPSGGGSYTRLDGEFREMAIADSKIREIAASAEPFVVRGVRGDEDWLINSAWAARQGVRAFLAFPLVAQDAAVGVFAVFDREMPSDALLEQMRLLADIAAYRAADLRNPPTLTSVPLSDLRPPEAPPSPASGDGGASVGRRSLGGTEVLTRAELRVIERENIVAALARTEGKVFGPDGAAALLGMRPTTLASRIKALRIR